MEKKKKKRDEDEEEEERQEKKGKKKLHDEKHDDDATSSRAHGAAAIPLLARESKAARLERVSAWLRASSDSVAQYVVPAQLAYYADKGDAQGEQLARASWAQFQSEECYRRYAEELTRCAHPDALCLAQWSRLASQCHGYTQHAASLLGRWKEDEK